MRLVVSLLLALVAPMALGADPLSIPAITLGTGANGQQEYSVSLQILLIMTALSFIPAFVMLMTSFTRIIIVFSFLRQAMGVQQLPPTQILASLAIFMTVVIMYPVGKQINDNALQPYLAEQIDYKVALDRAQAPLRTFMFKHTREKDLSVFYSISKMEAPRSKEEVPTMLLAAPMSSASLKPPLPSAFSSTFPFWCWIWSSQACCWPWA